MEYLSCFWLQEYPKLKVRKAAKDICGYCYKIAQCHKQWLGKANTSLANLPKGVGDTSANGDANEDDEDGAEDADNADNAEDAKDAEERILLSPEDVEAQEQDILDAAKHVKAAVSMRAFFNIRGGDYVGSNFFPQNFLQNSVDSLVFFFLSLFSEFYSCQIYEITKYFTILSLRVFSPDLYSFCRQLQNHLIINPIPTLFFSISHSPT